MFVHWLDVEEGGPVLTARASWGGVRDRTTATGRHLLSADLPTSTARGRWSDVLVLVVQHLAVNDDGIKKILGCPGRTQVS